MNNAWTADRLIAESNDIRKFYKKGPYKHHFYEDGGRWYVRGQERKEEEVVEYALGSEQVSIENLFDTIDEEEGNDDEVS